jgi:cytochrome c oxidase cbb3-type subunit 3
VKREETPSQPEPGTTVHVYDDIVEEDNQLPRWWLGTLFGAIAFATFYWYGDQELQRVAFAAGVYEDQMIAIRLAEASRGGGMSPDALLALARPTGHGRRGKEVFASTCAPCHRADGGGNIGPNLTDEFWLHGSAPDKIWKTVHDGVPAKGMAGVGPRPRRGARRKRGRLRAHAPKHERTQRKGSARGAGAVDRPWPESASPSSKAPARCWRTVRVRGSSRPT